MKCQNCGSEISDDIKYCPFCGGLTQNGAAQNSESSGDFGHEPGIVNQTYGSNQSGYNDPQSSSQGNYNDSYTGGQGSYNGGYTGGQGGYTGGYNPGYQNAQPLPMKWYKFIIYVQLFLGALSNVVNGFMCLTGAHYGSGMADYIYDYYGFGLRIVDILMGVVSIGLAVIAVLVRQQLARYKKNSPMMYLGYVGITAVVSIVYTLFASLVVGMLLFDSSTVSSLISSILIIVLSITYFKKREHLFVN